MNALIQHIDKPLSITERGRTEEDLVNNRELKHTGSGRFVLDEQQLFDEVRDISKLLNYNIIVDLICCSCRFRRHK